jgi:WD40 repeat protein
LWSNRTALQTQEQLAASLELRDKKLEDLQYKEFTSDLRQVAEALQHGGDRAAQTILERYDLATLPPECDHFAFRYLQSLMVRPSRIAVRHEADLLDMDVSPDDRWMITTDRRGDIVITDLQSEQEVHRLHPADKEVTRVQFSSDGKLLASVGQDRMLRLWKTGSWEAVKTLRGHDVTINGLAWSPTGDYLATGDRAGHVCIWDMGSGEVIRRLPKHHGAVRTIAWSSDGKYLATADGEVGVNLWTTSDWSLRASFDSKGAGMLSLAFAPDNGYLVCGGYLHELIVVDLHDMQFQYVSLDSHGGPWSLTFGAVDQLLAGVEDGSLRCFELSRNKETWTQRREIVLTNTRSNFRRVKQLSQRPELLVGSEQTREVIRLPRASVRGYRTWDRDTQFVGCVKELQVLIGSRAGDGNAAVYDAISGGLLKHLDIQVVSQCRPCYSSKLGQVAISGWDEQGFCVALCNPSDWTVRNRIPSSGQVNHLSISQDGTKLILCCAKSTAPQCETSVYDLVTNKWRGLNEPFGSSQVTADFSPTEDLLIYGTRVGRQMLSLDANRFETVAATELNSDLYCLHSPPAASFVLIGQANHLSCYSSDLKARNQPRSTHCCLLSCRQSSSSMGSA